MAEKVFRSLEKFWCQSWTCLIWPWEASYSWISCLGPVFKLDIGALECLNLTLAFSTSVKFKKAGNQVGHLLKMLALFLFKVSYRILFCLRQQWSQHSIIWAVELNSLAFFSTQQSSILFFFLEFSSRVSLDCFIWSYLFQQSHSHRTLKRVSSTTIPDNDMARWTLMELRTSIDRALSDDYDYLA